MPRKSKLRWTRRDNGLWETTHDGTTWVLWSHGYSTGKNGWFLHRVLPNGNVDQGADSVHLGTNVRIAKAKVELELVDGWAYAYQRRSHDGHPLWRGPDGELLPLADLLDGRHRETR